MRALVISAQIVAAIVTVALLLVGWYANEQCGCPAIEKVASWNRTSIEGVRVGVWHLARVFNWGKRPVCTLIYTSEPATLRSVALLYVPGAVMLTAYVIAMMPVLTYLMTHGDCASVKEADTDAATKSQALTAAV